MNSLSDENIMIQKFHVSFLRNDHNELLPLINQIEEDFPNSTVLNYYVGMYWKKINQNDTAKDYFLKCISLNRLFASAYFDLNDLIPFDEIEPLLKSIFGKKTVHPTNGNLEFQLEPQLRITSILGQGYADKGEISKAVKVYEVSVNNLEKKWKKEKKFTNIEWQCWKNMTLSLGSLNSNRNPEKAVEFYAKGLSLVFPFIVDEIDVTVSISFIIRELDTKLLNGLYLTKNYCMNFDESLISKLNVNSFFETWRKGILTSKIESKKESIRENKIRIGYLSPDFNKNAAGLFITPLLKHYDRNKFEVFCYDNNSEKDMYSDLYRTHSDVQWYNISQMNGYGVYNMIKANEIDILIDLIGHGHKNRMEVLAMKPCDIIINYLGYPGFVDLKEVDYRIVDEITDPNLNSIQSYSGSSTKNEKLLYLNRCFVCYSLFENTKMPLINHVKSENGKIRIGIMNKSSKYSEYILKIWNSILKKNKKIELWIKLDQVKTKTEEELQKNIFKDFPSGQIHFFKFCDTLPAYFELFNRIDYCIDTYPYSGTTTTCSALLMGVPTFTIYNKNKSHVSNVTSSIMHHCDLKEPFICGSTSGYKESICKYVPEFDRREIRNKFLSAMDPELFMRELETKLEKVFSVVIANVDKRKSDKYE